MKRLLLLSFVLISAFTLQLNAQNCGANFNYTVNGLSVDFSDTSFANSSITSYSWTFGDGDSSTLINPTHTYFSAGTYAVCLTITDVSRCTDTFCDSISVSLPPPCAVSYDYWVDSSNTVQFNSSVVPSVGSGNTYSWNFGDGSANDTSANPVHSYASSGAYGVSLFITNSVGDSCNYFDTVYVNECFLSVSIDTIRKGVLNTVNYTSYTFEVNSRYVDLWNAGKLGQGNVIFSWEYGNGGRSMGNGPFGNSNLYYNTGSYIVSHTQHDTLNNNICKFTDTIEVVVECKSRFQSQINQDSLSITNRAKNYTNLIYYFGDGDSSLQEDPTHLYQTSGTYIITQTVFDTLNNCSSTSSDTIAVTVPKPPCSSAFMVIISNDTAEFTNNATNFTNLIYEFGDGTSSTEENPTHIYDSSGSYSVCQTVFDSLRSCTSTTCQTISVSVPQPCKAGFSYQTVGDSIWFVNSATSYNRLEYDFGDGNTSTEINPYHLYTNSGTYTVTQTVYNDARNCSDTFTDTISVSISTSCDADFVVAVDTSKSKLLFLINYSSSHPNHEYQWTFGDGGTGTGRTPSHLYTDYGKYEICLTVKDDTLGCTSTYCDSLGLDSNSNVLKANGFTLQVIDGRPIGIEENDLENQLSVFPNPVGEQLNVSLPQTSRKISYRLLNINGKIEKEGILNQQSNQLDFSSYNTGIYLIQFTDGKNVVVKRVIKR